MYRVNPRELARIFPFDVWTSFTVAPLAALAVVEALLLLA
jgi:hypothetical protein